METVGSLQRTAGGAAPDARVMTATVMEVLRDRNVGLENRLNDVVNRMAALVRRVGVDMGPSQVDPPEPTQPNQPKEPSHLDVIDRQAEAIGKLIVRAEELMTDLEKIG